MATTVRQLLQMKSRDIWTISPEATVLDALKEMADKNVGALLVVEDDRLVGIFSERDYARYVVLEGRTAESTRIREIMTPRVVFVRPEQTVEDCMALMTDKHIRHLPVLDADRLVGVISIGDVVKEIISDQEFTIRNLENYITGSK